MDFARVADIVAGFLGAQRQPVAVVGAFGLHAWGLVRATLDMFRERGTPEGVG